MELLSSENKIVGAWIEQDSEIKVDEASNRIEWLIENSFVKIATLNWKIIYQDKTDSRYWLLDYPQSHMHGGGPPCIECISKVVVDKMVKNHDN